MKDILVIPPTGDIKVIRQEEDISLDQYYELIDCTVIELIPETDLTDYEMICDEEGLVRIDKAPVINEIATLIAGRYSMRPIVGTVVLQPKGTLK